MTSKITPDHIGELMGRVTVHTSYAPHPTPHVIAVAWLDEKFYLGMAISKAVDPANFNIELGMEYSEKDAREEAKKKLWELEGYKLYSQS